MPKRLRSASLARLGSWLLAGFLVLAVSPLSPARAADAACRDIVDAVARDEKSHDWKQLLADGQSLQKTCGAQSDILKQGALLAIGIAQLRTAHAEDALTTARQCEATGSTKAYILDCRMIEAQALDELGKTKEERDVLVAILDSLPSHGSEKLRREVKAELASIDPAAAKEHGKRSRKGHGEPTPDAQYSGTGFVVAADGRIVTNWHVVAECSTYWTADGQKLSLIRGDKLRDLALLKSSQAASQVAALRADGPKAGESVVVYGFPLAGLLASSGEVTTGIVSAETGIHDTTKRFQISAPVQPGNSGSPVLDAQGRVIGVVQSGLVRSDEPGVVPQNVNFAVPEAELVGFLKDSGIAPPFKGDGQKSEVSDIVAQARSYVTQIICTPHA
jgi:S1-C subfamily serine protease